MNLQTRIYEKQGDLSGSEKEIIQGLLSSAKENSQLSLKDLSKKLYVSESAIFRLCKKLGLSGYSELKFELSAASSIKNHPNTNFVKEMADLTANTIKQFEARNLTNFYIDVQTAKTIYLYSTGWQQELLASYISKELFLIGKQTVLLPSALDELKMRGQFFKKGDMLWTISYSGNNTAVVNELKKLSLIGDEIKMVSLTKMGSNDLATISDYSFFFQTIDFSYQTDGSKPKSCFSPAYILIDLLINGYFDWQQKKG
ncbi:MurR/RpiR family transcriptional regulator [Lactobacillus mulieris]|uniref:MurR/RpiR family transcriptional regulator n=1 Tax=Lactobacillus mulieris TaxID=2508708 RepID=A0AAW5WWZ6_9LACO|nr:MurR/RpiR family transcriptional regulator [Lactobacillus mulieris]MCZ3621835.1 MurR/RpiR family transcriptional regulator [Lactobacillus mulieris]MCZ3623532.1 MurR/RpiR family transcriptional regulator [Lactobacillus mulieris]MCZ3635842.1 MurR/RpiR family transcriptional regulator [Lactobacillus mulieris]MCZ3689630.1 MurR/RpiR family transcriptional regulator [Lactobacillus mulieris]MCZ3695633.1 MurR/RpiR family transcriptional regulator [Lactobacillus mulieris]